MKRITVHIFKAGELAVAHSIRTYLKRHGVDAVVVTKHAVQIHPEDMQKAADVMPAWKWGWDRKEQSPKEKT